MLLTRPWSFKGWITLSTGCNCIWWIMLFVSLALIHRIAIYPLDSVICLLYNWAQFKVDSQCPKQSHKINRIKIRKNQNSSLWLLTIVIYWSILWLVDLTERTKYDWLLQLSHYRCPITVDYPITLSNHNSTEWLVKSKAATAPILFEEIVIIMIMIIVMFVIA